MNFNVQKTQPPRTKDLAERGPLAQLDEAGAPALIHSPSVKCVNSNNKNKKIATADISTILCMPFLITFNVFFRNIAYVSKVPIAAKRII